jgi:hypothetical protein
LFVRSIWIATAVPAEHPCPLKGLILVNQGENDMGKGILLWLLGVPIPIILLLWLFFH